MVSTRDRADRLPEFFRRLSGLRTERRWELVMVDNGSSDRTPAVLRDLSRRSPFPVRRLREPEPGLGRALNAGVGVSTGAIVATTDDDCYPSPDYVDAVLDLFERHAVGYLGGRVRLFDEEHAPVSSVDREEAALLPSPSFPHPGLIGGANLAFRRAVFDDVGGFDEMLGAGTPFPCEDVDFCARASVRGWHGAYFPEPVVYHDHRRHAGPAADEIRESYARARGAYYARTLLDLPPLRVACLKWWYWSLSSVPPGHTVREVVSALRYLGRRLGGRLRPVTARGVAAADDGELPRGAE